MLFYAHNYGSAYYYNYNCICFVIVLMIICKLYNYSLSITFLSIKKRIGKGNKLFLIQPMVARV